jgi:Flavodoxin domain
MQFMGTNIARRPALRSIAVVLLGLSAVAACLIGWGVHRPGVNLVNMACSGGSNVKQRILIACAIRAGSTAEVAQVIAEQVCAQGIDAQVLPVESVASIDGYQAVLLGSAVRYGGWLPEMLKFIESQRTLLANNPLAVFTMHSRFTLSELRLMMLMLNYKESPFRRSALQVYAALISLRSNASC